MPLWNFLPAALCCIFIMITFLISKLQMKVDRIWLAEPFDNQVSKVRFRVLVVWLCLSQVRQCLLQVAQIQAPMTPRPNPLTQRPPSPKHTWSWAEVKATSTSEWVRTSCFQHKIVIVIESVCRTCRTSGVGLTLRLPPPPQVMKVASRTVYQSRQPTSSRHPPRLSRATSSSGRSPLLMIEKKKNWHTVVSASLQSSHVLL